MLTSILIVMLFRKGVPVMNVVTRIVTVPILVALTACAPIQKLQQVKLPPERSYHRGFSLVPLNEAGWSIGQRDYNWLVLRRYGSSPDESYTIHTEVRGLPPLASPTEFINVVKEDQIRGTDPSRFTVMKHEVVPYPRKGDYCARSYWMTEDRAAVKPTGGIHLLILEIINLTCRHPASPNVAISVTYAHRHYQDHGDPALPEKAEMLFESVEFRELK